MRCLTAHRGDVYLAMRGPDSARVNSVSSPRRLRSLTTHRRPIPPHSPHSIPDFYQARDKPIPIGSYKRLPASSCIGNAPAINSTLLLSTTAPSHSRYNTNDLSTTIVGASQEPVRRLRRMRGLVDCFRMVRHSVAKGIPSLERPSRRASRGSGTGARRPATGRETALTFHWAADHRSRRSILRDPHIVPNSSQSLAPANPRLGRFSSTERGTTSLPSGE